VTGLFVALRILAVLGVYVVWAYLGFCVLTVYIADRRNPSVPSACDASLLDPLFYIASVVVTLLFLSGIGESESSGHTLYRPRSLQRPIVLFCCSHDCGRVCGLRLPWANAGRGGLVWQCRGSHGACLRAASPHSSPSPADLPAQMRRCLAGPWELA